MRNLISAIVGRQAAGMAITGGLMLAVAALGFIALGWLGFALYRYLLPAEGAVVSACITAVVFLAAALILLLIARHRLSSDPRRQSPTAPDAGGQPDIAAIVTLLLRDELPKNAVPATLIALLGGVAAGVNPQAARNLACDVLNSLTPKKD
jgi:hypothetical protein